MERAAWTDERLDDLAESMRTGFARVDQDIRDLRTEMHDGFSELRAAGHRTNVGLIVGFLGVIATIIARGG